MNWNQLKPAAVYLLVHGTSVLSVLWMHAVFGGLLSDAVVGAWFFFGISTIVLPLPPLAAAVGVSLNGLTLSERSALGVTFITCFIALLHLVGVLNRGIDWHPAANIIVVVLANVVPATAFLRLALWSVSRHRSHGAPVA